MHDAIVIQVLLQVIGTVLGAGGVWSVIRLEIKFLWRDQAKLEKRLEKLEEAAHN